MIKYHPFKVKDVVFIAILSAAITIAGLVTMPLVMSVTLFGVRNMASAFLYTVLISIGLLKVRKIGTLSLVGLLHGSVLLMMAPVMFWTMFLAGVFTEMVVAIFYRNYESDRAIRFASILFIPMTIPLTLLTSSIIHGVPVSSIVEKPLISLLLVVITIILSVLGTNVGLKIGNELRKAGKI